MEMAPRRWLDSHLRLRTQERQLPLLLEAVFTSQRVPVPARAMA